MARQQVLAKRNYKLIELNMVSIRRIGDETYFLCLLTSKTGIETHLIGDNEEKKEPKGESQVINNFKVFESIKRVT